jgi:hypothetical protein
MKRRITTFFIIILISGVNLFSQGNDLLQIESNYEIGQIEVGGPYVGIEIHKSFPMINRISFYYPVANSIDISKDYWKRENYRIMSMGMKIGNGQKFMLQNEPWRVIQSPYDVEFQKELNKSNVSIKYEFCKNKPAMVAEFNITNNSDSTRLYEIYIGYNAIVRTSHTYKLINKGTTAIADDGSLIKIDYDILETAHAQIFFDNVGEKPKYSGTNYNINKFENADEEWLNLDKPFLRDKKSSTAVAAFVYKKELQPGESKISESEKVIDYLRENYKNEIEEYENYVLNYSVGKNVIHTGNPVFDFTTDWALAILKTNAHYIDSDIVPMPAQAEYNFYFTHDALLTDLAAVNFDLERVKNDLKFIIKHADENNVIPHAYYWKDNHFKTEYAGTENWNHFWFVLVATRYLRNAGDIEFAKELYPYVQQSINTAMKNKENNLMYSFRPDWWDIGNNYGPRAYMTILAIRALREFNYFQSELKVEPNEIKKYQSIADTLHANLIAKLWNDDLKYLTSFYEDGNEDTHIYMGSMLASHFALLDEDKNSELMITAKENLLDENLGIYTLYPMDLHKLGDYMGFAGNEAGEPFYYANGGIWPHGNAWYVLCLISNKKYEDAYNFIKNIMTLNGVISSPNGQPAMYEYRISDKSDPDVYGKIDKPQFLWAGGWYLYSLYNLYGIRENIWNISVEPFLPNDSDSIKFIITFDGKPINVDLTGNGKYAQIYLTNNQTLPSYVLPENTEDFSGINIKMGELKTPTIYKAEAKINTPVYSVDKKQLSFKTESFAGNNVRIEILSPSKIERLFNEDNKITKFETAKLGDGNYLLSFEFVQSESGNDFKIIFN